MQTPPPFSPPGNPPRKSNTALWIVLIVVLCVVIPCGGLVALGFFGMNWFGKTLGPMARCAILFEGVRNSVEMYTKEHDGTLPKAETWQDDVKPYYAKWRDREGKDMGPFTPPSADGEWACEIEGRKTGLAFNSKLSGKKWEEIDQRRTTILIYEVETVMRNANGPYKERPKSSSPKLMGNPRGWIEIPVEGSVDDFKIGNN